MKKDLSMAQVETLLMLDAIGEGCPLGALAGRLGLCKSLAAAVDGAARGLRGLIEENEAGFALSIAGTRELKTLCAPASLEHLPRW